VEKLDFQPLKSKEDFRSNYRLHDLAEKAGKNLLLQWGVEFKTFGEDKRFEKLWEKGEDKPDIIIEHNGIKALLDWKGKHTKSFLVNTRAIKSYEQWQKKFKAPVIIAFLLFDEQNNLTDRRFALLPEHAYAETEKAQWDKNKTVKFKDDLPKFTKENIINLLRKHF